MENMKQYHHGTFHDTSVNTIALIEQTHMEMYHSDVVDHTTVKPHRILVVDDSPTVRKIVGTCLQRAGFDVVGFPDGIEALRWFTKPEAFVPDLVILDIGLPKVNGYEVALQLRKKPLFHKMVIVILTRRDGPFDKLRARLVGAQDYLTKPFKTEELLSVIASHLPQVEEQK